MEVLFIRLSHANNSSSDHSLIFIKNEKELAEYYTYAKAFISVGEESFGLCEVEAMSSGTPVIAYKKGGVLETVTENLTGIFFEKIDPIFLEKAIFKLEENYNKFDLYKISQEMLQFDKEIFKQKIKDFIESKIK